MKPLFGLALTLLSTAALVTSTRLSNGEGCPLPQPLTHCDGTWRTTQLGIANTGNNCAIRWICVPDEVRGSNPSAAGSATGAVHSVARFSGSPQPLHPLLLLWESNL